MTTDFNFSVISLRSKSKLNDFVEQVFEGEGSARKLGVDAAKLRAFIKAIGDHYRNNPYHNFHHAADTTNTMAWLINLPVFQKNLPDIHKFILLVTALVHDVEHPGNDNQWEIKTKSAWAKQYNNESVLENRSLTVTRQILENPDCGILANLTEKEKKQGLKLLESFILSTDFTLHQKFIEEFSNYLSKKRIDFSNGAFLNLIGRALIKAADIGNTAKPFRIARRWGLRVMKEYWAQGIEEKSRRLPVGPLNDPAKAEFNISQAGFIENSALDLFQLLAKVEGSIDGLVKELVINKGCYEQSARRKAGSIK